MSGRVFEWFWTTPKGVPAQVRAAGEHPQDAFGNLSKAQRKLATRADGCRQVSPVACVLCGRERPNVFRPEVRFRLRRQTKWHEAGDPICFPCQHDGHVVYEGGPT